MMSQDAVRLTSTSRAFRSSIPLCFVALLASSCATSGTGGLSSSSSRHEPFFLRLDKQGAGISVDYTVPKDKLLVIEAINVESMTRKNQMALPASIRIRPPGQNAINATDIQVVFIPLTPVSGGTSVQLGEGPVAFDRVVGSVSTRVYAKAKHELLIELPGIIDGATGSGTGGVIVISGYLLPANSNSLTP